MTLVERTQPVDHKAVLTASGTKRATSSFSYSSTFSSSISSESISSAIAKTVGFQKSVGIDISASYSIEVPAYKKLTLKQEENTQHTRERCKERIKLIMEQLFG